MKAEEDILQFKEIIYQKLKNTHSTYSAYYIQGDFLALFKKSVNIGDLLYYFRNDNRFIFLNDDHIILKETLEKIVCNLSDKDDEEIIDFLKDNYFLKSVHKDVIEKVRSSSNKNKKFVIKYDNRIYEIKDEKEFIDVILEETYVTYEVLEAFAKFTDKLGTEVFKDAIERNVEIKEDRSVRYAIEYKEYGSTVVNKGEKAPEYLFSPDTKSIKKGDDENILLLDLRTNELIACLIMLSYYRNEKEINCNVFLPRHIEALRKLGIIYVYDKNLISVTTIGEALIEAFYDILEDRISELYDLVKKLGNVKELAKSKQVKYIADERNVWSGISSYFVDIYLSNYYSRTFLYLVLCANKINKINMVDIFLTAIEKRLYNEILNVLLGEHPTSGLKAIYERKDICLKCTSFRCRKHKGGIVNIDTLLNYRQGTYVREYIKSVKNDSELLRKIEDDLLLIKFMIPYNLTSKTKTIMIKTGIILPTAVLHKKDGQYCPFNDIWVVSDDINKMVF